MKSKTDRQLVATRAHDALAFAREQVRAIRDRGIVGQLDWIEGGTLRGWRERLDPFDRDNSLHGLRETLKMRARHDPDAMQDLVFSARAGWGLADEALCELDRYYGFIRCDRPVLLDAYMQDRVRFGRPSRVRSMQTNSHYLRDIAILFVIRDVCARFGMRPRRSPAQRQREHPSGCAVTTQALHAERAATIDEDSVEHVWSRLHGLILGGGAH
ncbi:hypothetical protein Q2941_17400 [Bradyrhizobium sp. UFLA05-153]